MASFCTQCGTSLESGARFCSRCGNAVLESAESANRPVSSAAPPPVPKSGGALKVVLIVLGVLVGIGILAGAAVIFGIWGLSRAVQVDPSGENIRIETPMGVVTMGETGITEQELGIPLYPGAEEAQAGFRMGTSDATMGTFMFQTTDSPEQVLEFYRSQLGDAVDVVATPQGGIITSAPSDKEGYMITVGRDEDNARTVITVVRGIAAQ